MIANNLAEVSIFHSPGPAYQPVEAAMTRPTGWFWGEGQARLIAFRLPSPWPRPIAGYLKTEEFFEELLLSFRELGGGL